MMSLWKNEMQIPCKNVTYYAADKALPPKSNTILLLNKIQNSFCQLFL
jgi:hypothetical protein